MAFDLLVKPQIKLLEIPSQRCVELVYEELIKICHTCGSNELSRYPKLQGKLIEVVSNLLRERLGPSSTYVESLISIQRAYINTNHPNFLGAAAAMGAVMADREEKAKKALAAEERRKREKRRQRELNGVNGADIQEEEEEQTETVDARVQRGHTKASRSMSPAVGKGSNGINNLLHGADRLSSQQTGGAAAASNARDSFLNYFFGKDGHPSAAPPVQPFVHSNHGARHLSLSQESNVVSRNRLQHERSAPEPLMTESMDMALHEEPLLPLEPDVPALTEQEQLETDLIRRLISSYFNIVRESIADQVPKAVMHLLVNHSKDVVQNRLVSELYREDLFQDLLHEDDAVTAEREKCEKLLTTYKEAARIIGEVL